MLLLLLGLLCTVLGTSLTTVSNTLSIESASDDVVTYTRKVLYTSASDENDAVLLKVVTDTRDIRSNFISVCELNSGDLSHS